MAVPLASDAKADAARITRHYASEAGPAVARQFVSALRAARQHVRQYPESGSPRFADITGLDRLRCWPLRGFPYLLFYRDGPEGIEVLRILHSARDIPSTLRP